MELTLKHIFARNIDPYLLEILHLFKKLHPAERNHFAEIVLTYIIDRAELANKKSFIDLVSKELTPEIGDKVMTLAEEWKNEGIKKGLQQGIQKGLERGVEQGLQQGISTVALRLLNEGSDLDFIAKITGLSLAKIQELKKNQH